MAVAKRFIIRQAQTPALAERNPHIITIRGVDFNIFSMIGWIIEPPLLTALALMIEGKPSEDIWKAVKTVALFTPLNVIGGGFWYLIGTHQLTKFIENPEGAEELRR